MVDFDHSKIPIERIKLRASRLQMLEFLPVNSQLKHSRTKRLSQNVYSSIATAARIFFIVIWEIEAIG